MTVEPLITIELFAAVLILFAAVLSVVVKLRRKLRRKRSKPETVITKERLFRWREELIKSAEAIRVLERISGHYLLSCPDPKRGVQRVLGEAWGERRGNQSELWSTIGDIEFILSSKYGMALMDSGAMLDLQMKELEAKIAANDGNMQIVRKG